MSCLAVSHITTPTDVHFMPLLLLNDKLTVLSDTDRLAEYDINVNDSQLYFDIAGLYIWYIGGLRAYERSLRHCRAG